MIVRIDDDFDLYKIVNSGQCFRPKILNDGSVRFITKDKILYIRVTSSMGEYEVSCDKTEWEQVWYDYFDLERSYSEIRKTVPENDKYMLACAEAGSGIRILKQDKWEMLISFIISQRKSIPAIRSSVEKLCSLYGKRVKATDYFDKDDELIYLFPEPVAMENASSDELASCGLGYRVPYIRCAVESVLSGDIRLESIDTLGDEELFDTLKSIKGVGDKVANCVELFAYHRVSRAPVDTWIKKVIDEEYKGINPFPFYGKNAGIMQQYVFYRAQHLKEL